MNAQVHTFKNRKELAQYLGISRNTLTSRMLKLDFQVAQFPCSITLEQLEHLKLDGRSKNTTKITKKSASENIYIPKNEFQDELTNARNEINEIQKERIAEQKKHAHDIILMNQEIVRLADQAQQLQLDLQQKLTQHSSEVEQLKLENKIIQEELAQEKAKSFWQKLFHK